MTAHTSPVNAESGKRTVWYVLGELRTPNPEPFAVFSVDTTKCEGTLVGATIISLHTIREEAERIVHEFNEGPLS
jgi:hypothetical protein